MQKIKNLVKTYEMQFWMAFYDESAGDYGEFVRVTEDKSFDASREGRTYEAQYLCDADSTEYRLGNKDGYSFEIDLAGPEGVQKHLVGHEDDLDVPVLLVRTIAWDFEADEACPADALCAKQREGMLNLDPVSGSAGNPLTIKGSVAFVAGSSYERGTFDPATRKFTPEGSASQS